MPKITKDDIAAALRRLGGKKTWVGMLQNKKSQMAEQASEGMDVPGIPMEHQLELPLGDPQLPQIGSADDAIDFYKQVLAGGADPTDFLYGGAQYGFSPVDSPDPVPPDMIGDMFTQRFKNNKAGLKVTKRKK